MYFHVAAARRKVHTVSRKSERLVNLTIALLATKRYLTKSEIFKTVAGYSGDPEAKDRMFERDKEDLRSLGITIELGSFDPLFEDEAGYRIKPESYALQLRELSPTQIALLSKAAQLWREAAFSEPAQSGLRKLKSIGIDSDFDAIAGITTTPPPTPEQLPEIIEAISDRRRITFEYRDEELKLEVRTLEPHTLSNSGGHWYITGRDCDRGEARTFRLDRFASAVKLSSHSNAYTFDSNVAPAESQRPISKVAQIRIRKGRGVQLRQSAQILSEDSEWDLCEIPYFTAEHLIRSVLWCGDDAEVISPAEIRAEIIARLTEVVKLHG